MIDSKEEKEDKEVKGELIDSPRKYSAEWFEQMQSIRKNAEDACREGDLNKVKEIFSQVDASILTFLKVKINHNSYI